MRRLVIVLIACGLATACDWYDTAFTKKWARTIQPRLSANGRWRPCTTFLRRGHVVPEAQCEGAKFDTSRCSEPRDAAAAARMIAFQQHCTDEAIRVLEANATNPAVLNDLAAAYYVSAQRRDRPEDLLAALKNAQDAVTAGADANFNLALAQESVGLREAAIATWTRAADDTKWGAEAREHLAASRAIPDPKLYWDATLARLRHALQSNDRAAVARLIHASPRSAEEFVEEVLLPEHVAEAKVLAEVWQKRTGDSFLVDVVRAFETTTDGIALKQGHEEYKAARKLERAFQRKEATPHYQQASVLLARAHSPLRVLCELRLDPARAETSYPFARARIWAYRAHNEQFDGRFPDSIDTYGRVIRYYESIGDSENAAITYGRRASVYVQAGDYENGWRDAYRASRFLHSIIDTQERHTLLGELGDASLSAGYPNIALLYRNVAVRALQNNLLSIPPERKELIKRAQTNLAIAYYKKAAVEAQLGQIPQALRDLNESNRLGDTATDTEIRRLLQASASETAGRTRISLNPKGAVADFTQALQLSAGDTFPTYRAYLLAQRADAQRRAGQRAAAERDLAEAMRVLRSEQTVNLENRSRKDNDLWIPYFSRFRDALDSLTRLLMEDKRYIEAFDYVEAARAAEPLDLVMRAASVPEMAALKRASGMERILAIQKRLPYRTFVVQYAVLDDRTYAWILCRDLGVVTRHSATRTQVARWAADVQDSVKGRLDFSLETPYAVLMKGVLEAIKRMPGGDHPRLVIIPDGAMHGLPLAALKNGATNEFLVDEVSAIEVAPSALFYVNSLLRDAELPPTERNLLLIGNPTFDRSLPIAQGLPELNAAEEEVRKIRDLYGDLATPRVQKEATVPVFMEMAPGAAIVHVAGHTIVDARTPGQSVILLAPSPNHSGALTAAEILNQLELKHTRLFVLSTCSSAGGRPVGSEGMAPLVRPFLTAGVPAVVGTLWDVDDATAKDLMVSFHTHYGRGEDAATALRNAQEDLLHGAVPDRNRAIAWSAFQVIGHASSPYAAPHNEKRQKEKPP